MTPIDFFYSCSTPFPLAELSELLC